MASRKNVSTGLNVFPRIRFKGFFDAWEQRKFKYWFVKEMKDLVMVS